MRTLCCLNFGTPRGLAAHSAEPFRPTLVFVTSVSNMFCTTGYNARRQRVLKGKTPALVVAERFTAKLALASTEKVSQPDTLRLARSIENTRFLVKCLKNVSM